MISESEKVLRSWTNSFGQLMGYEANGRGLMMANPGNLSTYRSGYGFKNSHSQSKCRFRHDMNPAHARAWSRVRSRQNAVSCLGKVEDNFILPINVM